jgi:hypothetical protein
LCGRHALDHATPHDKGCESEYFRFYLNGNLHIVFKRADLAKANKIVADYYGETLADARRAS